jgi:AraC family transcriptional regulator, arabinose operon regulatory protein
MDKGKIRRFALPKAALDEALIGGFSSLWLPIEIGAISDSPTERVAMENGTKDLIVGLCTGGQGYFEYARERVEIREGQVWATAPGIAFAYGSEGGEPWSLYWFRGRGSRIAWLRKLLVGEDGDPVFTVENIFPIAALFEEIMELLGEGSGKRDLDCAALAFGHLVAELRRRRPAEGEGIETVDERMDRVVAWIDAHASSEIRVAELASMCNLSGPYFAACFRRRTGYRVLDYAAGVKMKKARRLLEETNLPIKEIAAAVGYADQLYFSRSYKKAYGFSPLASRQAMNEGDTAP